MRAVLASLILPMVLTASATAEGQSHNSDAPISVRAETLDLLDRENRAVLTGDVVITQAEMTLAAPRVTVTYTGQLSEGRPEVSRLDAAGGVTVTRPDQSARSSYAVYDVNRRVITMIGGVTLKQGANVIQGGRLSINLDTGRATIDGSGVGGSSTGTTQTRGGRVTGTFSVPKRDNAPAPAASPTPQP